jgi:hypothetical protein
MSRLTGIAERQFAPGKVPIHVVLVGKSTAPATRDVADPENPGQCLSPADIRRRQASDISIGETISDRNFYQRPNGLTYSPSSYSCNTTSADAWWGSSSTLLLNCGSAAREHFLNQNPSDPFLRVQTDLYKIVQMTGGVWAPIRPNQPNCSIRGCQPCSGCGTWQTIPLTNYALMDPECKAPKDQIQRYLDTIFGVNPYGLFLENPRPKDN